MKRNFFILSVLFSVLGIVPAAASVAPASFGQGIAYYKAGFPQVAKPLLIAEVQSSSSNLAEDCFYLGNIYFFENQVDSAQYYFQKGNQVDPTNSLNAVGLSMLKIKSDAPAADLEYKNILKLKQNKKNVDILIAVSNAYLHNGIIDVAQSYADRAKALKSRYAPVYVLLGDIEFAKKNIGESCKFYDQAIYFDDKSKEGFVKYARAYKSVNPTLAIQKLNDLKAKEPGFLLVDREMADVYYATNDFAKAAELYANYLKSGNSNIQDFTKYAFTLFLNGEYAKSLEVTNMGLLKAPRNPVFNRLAMYNNVELKQNAASLTAADNFFNKTDKPVFTFLDFRYFGQAYRNIDSINLAIPQYETALKYDSSKIELWKDISEMYEKKASYSKSVESYKKYISGLSEDKITIDVNYKLGRLLYNVGLADTTISAIDKKAALLSADSLFALVSSKEETNYRGYYWRAKTNLLLDPKVETDVAKNLYEKTAALCESKADPRYNSIIVDCYKFSAFYYIQRDDNANAKIYLNKMLAIEPANAWAKTTLTALAADEKNAKERAAKIAAKAAAKAAAAKAQQ